MKLELPYKLDRDAVQPLIAAWRLALVGVLTFALGLLCQLAGCSAAAQVTDWAENPSFRASAGIKLEEGRWRLTGGIDLGWIRVGAGGGCLVMPVELCWEWPGGAP